MDLGSCPSTSDPSFPCGLEIGNGERDRVGGLFAGIDEVNDLDVAELVLVVVRVRPLTMTE